MLQPCTESQKRDDDFECILDDLQDNHEIRPMFIQELCIKLTMSSLLLRHKLCFRIEETLQGMLDILASTPSAQVSYGMVQCFRRRCKRECSQN